MPELVGPDTCVLVIREPVLDGDGAQTYDGDGRPVYSDRRVTRTGQKVTINPTPRISAATGVPPIAVYSGKAALTVDAETRALLKKDAIEFDGKLYEMTADALVKRTLIDSIEHHVRVFLSREEVAEFGVELVVHTPRGQQDDRGRRAPDGEPATLPALAVDAGNTQERYGVEGTVEEADFTVVLALGSGVRDGDWITVRGRRGLARVAREFSEHANRNQDVVLVRARSGGG